MISKAPVVMKLCRNVGNIKNNATKVCMGYSLAVKYHRGGDRINGMKVHNLSPNSTAAIANRCTKDSTFINNTANGGGGKLPPDMCPRREGNSDSRNCLMVK